MRARDRGRAFGRIVALGAALAVLCAAAPEAATAAPGAQRQPGQQQQKRVLKLVVVGDSFSSGEGIRGTYIEARDPRHQSRESAAIQAAARLQAANPGLQVEVTIVASSGATTSDVFETQRKDPAATIPGGTPQNPLDQSTWHHDNDLAVNYAQLDQIPADADAIIIGLGGNDSLFGPLVKSMVTSFVAAQRGEARALQGAADQILDNTKPDEFYRQQADDYPDGYAPTLIARLLQVTQAIQNKAKNAALFLQNYPVGVDPNKPSWSDMLGEDLGETDLRRMQNFAGLVNSAIERAVQICQCAKLADVSKALEGRELNSDNPAINSVWFGTRGDAGQMKMSEPFHPNREGAALMSDDIGTTLARDLGLTVPERQKDAPTDTSGVMVRNTAAPDTDRDGRADYADGDWDGDGYANFADQDPNVANPPPPVRKPRTDTAPPRARGSRGDSGPNTRDGADRGADRGALGPSGPAPGPRDTGTDPAPPPRRPGDGNGAAGGDGTPPPSPAPQQPNPQPPTSHPPRPQPPRPQPPTPRPPTPQPPNPQPPNPQPPTPPNPPNSGGGPAPQPPTPPRQDGNAGGGTTQPKPASARKLSSPVIPPSTPMRTPSPPNLPKTPSTPRFDPNFHPQGVRQPNIGGGVLGVKPPTPPGPTLPSPRTPISPYPLGGGKRTDPPLSGSKVPDDGSPLSPPPTQPSPPPTTTPPQQSPGSGSGSTPVS
ncbi:SGNH/GDSL hydrolase family protein [Actinophytocola xanthii]|uniref:SGNH hydrolase-type esterase domain-containing protein n=1 Tax=Actinophytocola xanthii TaxID=1912961 RepID=A0A1Q8CY84_9PSEU|nr:SGNH/GDSL hydrolase family protein [Actinophytocola xanthii]OLF19295.1 hypothetical protein BU204_02815 [Actinophytocola xanthii]